MKHQQIKNYKTIKKDDSLTQLVCHFVVNTSVWPKWSFKGRTFLLLLSWRIYIFSKETLVHTSTFLSLCVEEIHFGQKWCENMTFPHLQVENESWSTKQVRIMLKWTSCLPRWRSLQWVWGWVVGPHMKGHWMVSLSVWNEATVHSLRFCVTTKCKWRHFENFYSRTFRSTIEVRKASFSPNRNIT